MCVLRASVGSFPSFLFDQPVSELGQHAFCR